VYTQWQLHQRRPQYATAGLSRCPSVRHTGGSVKNGWSWDNAISTIR